MNTYTVIGMTTESQRTEATIDAESYDVALQQVSVMVTEISTLKFAVVRKN